MTMTMMIMTKMIIMTMMIIRTRIIMTKMILMTMIIIRMMVRVNNGKGRSVMGIECQDWKRRTVTVRAITNCKIKIK